MQSSLSLQSIPMFHIILHLWEKSQPNERMFFWNFHFFEDSIDVGNLISSSSAFSQSSLNIWKFMVQELLKPGLENFEHYFTSMWDECNCAVVWAFFGIAFLWNENWPFLVLWSLLSFPDFLNFLCHHSKQCFLFRKEWHFDAKCSKLHMFSDVSVSL